MSRQLAATAEARRATRFAVTGMISTGAHTAIALSFLALVAQKPTIANGVAFVGATLLSYVINTLWSFSAPLGGIRLLKYVLVSLTGLMVAMTTAWVADSVGLSHIAGILVVMATVAPLTYLMHSRWTYR